MNDLVTNLSVIAEDGGDRYPAHVKKLAEAAASRIAALEVQLAERAGGVNEDALRALAQAYDREDSAQRGEPNPWSLDDPGDIGDSDTWVSERLACARAAAEAFLSALTTEPAAPEGRQEPVAWIDFADNGNVRLWTSEKHRADAEMALSRKMTPVYTAPPADAGMREALAWCVSEIELEFSRNKKAYPPDPEKKKRFDEAKRLAALTAPGATTKTDVEALAATTAERPGTVTSEPEPSTSDPSSTRSDAELFERHTGLKLKITDATRSDVTVEEYERSIIAWADDEDIELTDRQVRALVGALLETHQIRRK